MCFYYGGMKIDLSDEVGVGFYFLGGNLFYLCDIVSGFGRDDFTEVGGEIFDCDVGGGGGVLVDDFVIEID